VQGTSTQRTQPFWLTAAAFAACAAMLAALLTAAPASAQPPGGSSVLEALRTRTAVPVSDPIATTRRRRHSHRKRIRNSRDLGRGAAAATGGGFSLLAPWPADRALVAGGKCGFFMQGSAHRDYGGQWDDDRKAVDFGTCGAADFGTPVLAAHSGTVQIAADDPAYGKTVVVETTKNGFATRYAHLNKITVKKKQRVVAGQQIGTIGHSAAGTKDNAHLHFAAYKNRKAHSAVPPTPMASVNLCDGCLVQSLTQRSAGGAEPFQAAVQSLHLGDSRSGRVEVAPGQVLEFGIDVRFNEAFDAARFVMRPAAAAAARFAPPGGDLLGTPSMLGGDTASYTGVIQVPLDVAPGEYPLSWDVTDLGTGKTGNARATLTLVVKQGAKPVVPPKVFPSPRPGAPDWEATPVGISYPRIIAPGQQAEVELRAQNTGTAIWDSKVRLATSDGAPIRNHADGLGQNRLNATGEDGDGLILPGEVATFRYPLLSGSASAYRQLFTLIRDSAGGARFGGFTVPTVIADEQHWPPELAAADCTWSYMGQEGGLSANGQSGQYTFKLRNDSDLCPWFKTGDHPFRLGTQRAQDRASRYHDPSDPAWLGPTRVQLPRNVAPGEDVSVTFSLKPTSAVEATVYNEYFTPVIDGWTWLTDRGMFAPIDSSIAFTAPTSTVAVPRGGSTIMPVQIINRTGRTWQQGTDNIHFVDPLGNDLVYPHCGSNPPGWINSIAVQFDSATVPPGGTATYPVRLCGDPGYSGPATVRFRYVHEGVSAFNPIRAIGLQIG
jgi:murein DD-endopeptidase MepM/ murein hydrolase activator NlpD